MPFRSIDAVLQVTPFAIFGGRGGRNQQCPFHQAYLDEKDRLRARYVIAKTNAEKRLIQELLIQWVILHDGEFYKRNQQGSYKVMTRNEKLKKAAHTLRGKRKKYPTSARSMNIAVPRTIHVASNGITDFPINDANNVDADIVGTVEETTLEPDECVASHIDEGSLMTFPLDMYDDIDIDASSELFHASESCLNHHIEDVGTMIVAKI